MTLDISCNLECAKDQLLNISYFPYPGEETGDGEVYLDLRQTRCPLLLVADYRFFSEMGGGSSKTTVKYLISLFIREHKI